MSDNNLESLMRDVARAVQGDARRRQLLPEIQARLANLDEQSRQSQRAHGTWRLSLLSAAACAAGVAIFVLRPMPISYAVDGAGAGRSGAVGEQLIASDAGSLALRFSDGSQVTLPPHAQAHVDALDAHGATVALEGGTVDVSVVHRAKTHWSVRAGRYTIRVTGTKFSAGWDRRTDTLTVTMREGSVEVTGPGMKAPARVVGGQRLRASDVTTETTGEAPEVVVEDASATTTTAAKVPAEAVAPPVAEEVPAPEVAAPSDEKAPPAPARDDRRASRARHVAPASTKLALVDAEWRGLEARGQMKEALQAALREADWQASCEQLRAGDLVKLGDVARVGGRPDLSEQAYKAARRRFPQADRALYGLGKLAFDQQKDYAAAARYFDSYGQRFPEGALSQEAAGLLLESRLKAGDNAGARDAATRYLDLFPHGPYAAQASKIVSH